MSHLSLYVKFEDWLSISVLRDRATRCEKKELKSQSFQKSIGCFQTPLHPNYSTAPEARLVSGQSVVI
jgi:hypothetical protein